MKKLTLALCLSGGLLLAGCGGSSGGGGNSSTGNNTGNLSNLGAFVVNNCNQTPSGQLRATQSTSGGSFPSAAGTTASNGLYSRNCLQPSP